MEEIKIRVWDKEENRMISGDRFAFEEYAPLNDLFRNNSKKFDFMLYTGYKDINGKEIYEGDIVRRPAFVDKDCYCKVSKLFGYIEMNSYAWCVVNKYKNKKYLSPLFIEEEVGELENIEVIGNIYENKNLLEED